jgi:hypothetical protein
MRLKAVSAYPCGVAHTLSRRLCQIPPKGLGLAAAGTRTGVNQRVCVCVLYTHTLWISLRFPPTFLLSLTAFLKGAFHVDVA